MSLYAENTAVSESKSKIEIDELLRKWKATSIAIGEDTGAGIVIFAIAEWHVRFRCPMPDEALVIAVWQKKHGKYDWPTSAHKANWIEQERKRRWRALLLTIKAKLVSVENGIEKFEEAFLAHIVIAGGLTVGQKALPELAQIYKSGSMPTGGLLGPGSGA